MNSGAWLRDHETLAAVVFTTVSIVLIGAFMWLERRFLQK